MYSVYICAYTGNCTMSCILYACVCVHVHVIHAFVCFPGHTEHGPSLRLLQEASSRAVFSADSCRPLLLLFSIH